MLMSVLMGDAVAALPPCDKELWQQGSLAELLYADDTLLLGIAANIMQRFLVAVSNAGADYGLELHWGKLQLLQVRCDSVVWRSDSSAIAPQTEVTYLGGIVSGGPV